MKKILFIGMPGSGKGTQAQLLKKFGFVHISTGDVIRAAFKNKDPILLSYKKHIDSGGLLPDKLIFKLIKKEISKNKNAKGIILDGAVRTLPQAKFVIENNLVDEVFYFSLTKEIAIERLIKRMKNSKEKRADDDPSAFEKRFDEYKTKTAPVINLLKQKTKFHKINAAPTIEKIHKVVKEILNLR